MVKIFDPTKHEAAVVKAGAEDGMLGVPDMHAANVSEYEKMLVDHGEQVIREFEGKKQQADADLKEAFAQAKDHYQLAKAAFEKKKQELGGRPVTKHIPMWGYVSSLVIIGLVELPVNIAAFSVIGDSPVLVWLLAMALGASLLIAAHLIGMSVRHRGFHAGSVAAIVLMAGIVIGLAYIRVVYFENPEEAADGAVWVSKAFVNMDKRALGVLFALMNIFFLLVATWLSYFSHDADEHYSQLKAEYEKARAKAMALLRDWQKQCTDARTDAANYIEMVHKMINLYRRSNRAARANVATPAIWDSKSPEAQLAIESFDLKVPAETL